MIQEVKNMANSTTTQNVAMGSAIGGGGPAGVVLAIRNAWPDLIPWSAEYDAVILAFVVSTLIPYVSRVIAMWRDPSKKIT